MTKAKKCSVITVTGLLMICFMAGASFAYGPHHNDSRGNGSFANPHHMMRGGNCDQFLVDRGIPADTVNAYIAEQDKFRDENRAVFEAMRAKSLELYEEMSKTAPNAEKAKTLQAEISKLRADFDVKQLEHQLYLRSTYPQICEIMHKDFAEKGFGPEQRGFGPGAGRPGPAINKDLK